jgi:hypothetical protein
MMKQWIVILLLLAASTSIAACVDLNAGNVNIDLRDGYRASFVLPDIGKPYVVEDAYAASTSDNTLFKPYGFEIYSDDVYLASMKMYVYSSPQSQYVREAGTEDSLVPDTTGPRVTIPKTISGALGYVIYDLQKGASGTDTSNAMMGFFGCFPGAWKESDGLKGIFEVSGQSGEFPASAQSLQVFNSMVDTITISGPSI